MTISFQHLIISANFVIVKMKKKNLETSISITFLLRLTYKLNTKRVFIRMVPLAIFLVDSLEMF